MLNKSFLYCFVVFALVFACFGPDTLYARNDSLAELKSELYSKIENPGSDSAKIIGLIKLGLALQVSPFEVYKEKSGQQYVQDALTYAEQTGAFGNIGYYLDSIGVHYRRESNFTVALRLHQLVENYAGTVGDKKLLSIVYNNMGVVYRYIDDYKKAISYHLKALDLAEKDNDSITMAVAINSLGNVELMLGEYDMALSYFKKSLRLEQNRKNLLGIAINFENIGSVYFAKGDYKKAGEYYRLSLDINKKIGSKKGEAICYSDLASVFTEKNKYKIAEAYLKHSIQLFSDIGNKVMLANSYVKLGKLYSKDNNYSRAEQVIFRGLKLAKTIGLRSVVEDGYKTLYQVNKNRKKYDKALNYLEIANMYHDSVINFSIQKEIARMQLKFESKQKENQILLLEQQAKIRELNLNKQKVLNYFLFTAFVLALIIVFVLSKYLRNKDNLNKKLIEKNIEIEQTQKQLLEQGEALKEAKLRAEESDRSKSEFLANISHEIRTPLNSVIGFSGVLEQSTNDPKIKEYVHSIKSSGESLLNLLNDILDLSKIEAGKIDVVYEPINIRAFLNEIKRIFEVEASRKSIELTVTFADGLPETVVMSRNRLRQILINLIGNAVKFTDKGSVTVSVLHEQGDQAGEIELIIHVTDTGKGINDDEKELIFRPFYQSKTNDSEAGTGLGLAITKKLVDALNGEIFVTSEPGVGTRFTMKFKRVKIEAADEVEEETDVSEYSREPFTALFVTGNTGLSEDARRFLVQRCRRVINVGTNLRLLRENIHHADIIVIAGLEGQMLSNTMQVIHGERPNNTIVVIGRWEEDAPGLYRIAPGSSKQNLTIRLNEIIKRLVDVRKSVSLFVNNGGNVPDPEFAEALRNIMENEYKKAVRTKMMQHIKLLADRLLQLANEKELPNLKDFAQELAKLVALFDIKRVDEYLNILSGAYRDFEKKE